MTMIKRVTPLLRQAVVEFTLHEALQRYCLQMATISLINVSWQIINAEVINL